MGAGRDVQTVRGVGRGTRREGSVLRRERCARASRSKAYVGRYVVQVVCAIFEQDGGGGPALHSLLECGETVGAAGGEGGLAAATLEVLVGGGKVAHAAEEEACGRGREERGRGERGRGAK